MAHPPPVALAIEPISSAPPQGKLIRLEWACEREGLSFPAVLRVLQENPQSLTVYQDAPDGALLVGSAEIARFADEARRIERRPERDSLVLTGGAK